MNDTSRSCNFQKTWKRRLRLRDAAQIIQYKMGQLGVKWTERLRNHRPLINLGGKCGSCRMFAMRVLGGLLGICLAANAIAEVYKWVDQSGRVHYEAAPPPDAKATLLNIHRSHSANPASEVEVQESTIQYYPVYGNTPYALHTSMLQNGPFNEIVQQHVYAEIHWEFKWKSDYTSESHKCRINRFNITLVTAITMPQWMDSEKAPAALQSLWPSVVSKIRTHENGHKAIGIEGANVLARRLRSLPVFDDCAALTREVNREGERIFNEYALANRAFDRTEALKDSPFKD